MTTASSYDSRLTNECPTNLKESSMPTDLPKQEQPMLTDSTNQELSMPIDLTETPNYSNEESPPPRTEVARPIVEADREKRFLEDSCKKGKIKAIPPVKSKELAANELIDKEVVAEFNKKHAVIHVEKFCILTEKPHHIYSCRDFTLESKQSLLDSYENQVVRFSGKRPITKATIWLKSPDRRTYDGFTFDPKIPFTQWTVKDGIGLYNLWSGYDVEAKPGDCSKYKDLIKDIICDGNKDKYDYLWKWLAHLIQHPDQLLPGIILMSLQGTGKNTFVDAISKIFGKHHLPLSSMKQLIGDFNYHQKNAVFIVANEALWGGNQKDIGTLKAMVTEKLCMIEGKGKDLIVLPNFKHLMVISNKDWPVHLDPDDRRFIVLNVSESHKEDKPYFYAILEELSNGGIEALLYELQQENLEGFIPWNLPQNDAAFDVKLQSSSSTEKYIYEALCEESFDIGNGTPTTGWSTQPKSTGSIYNDYSCWCEKNKLRQESKEALGKSLAKLMPSSSRKRERNGKNRSQSYQFPELKTARKEFQKSFKVSENVWK